MKKPYYENNGIYSPFIVSQVGSTQNEFVLSSREIFLDKDRFSQYLYTQVNRNNVKDTFFRIFSYNEKTVFTYYWSCTKTERYSNRTGLFVICGVMADTYYFFKNPHSTALAAYKLLMCIVDCVDAKIEWVHSDKCFVSLQENAEMIADSVYASFSDFVQIKRDIPIMRILRRGICSFLQKMKSDKKTNQSDTIMLLDAEFQNMIYAIINEVKEKYYSIFNPFDVSTDSRVTPVSIEILKNGDNIPRNVKQIKVIQIYDTKYLRLLW